MSSIDTATIRNELENALQSKFAGYNDIVIYCAGGASLLSESCFQMEGIDPKYYIDDTPEKHGTIFLGKPVINYSEAHELCKGALILVCCGLVRNQSAVMANIAKSPVEGAQCATVGEYIFCKNAEKVLSVFDSLEDDVSKETYANMIMVRMNKAKQNLVTPLCTFQYFGIPEFTFKNRQEVFVDCGAYVGDSIENFLNIRDGQFQKIYAFEPDNRNFQALQFRVERLKREWAISDDRIEMVQAGIGAKSCVLSVNRPIGGSAYNSATLVETTSAVQGLEFINVYSIDEYFATQTISFLKADIEGFEWPLLAGAETVIRRDKPKLALCIYHNASDMYRIACKIKELRPDYRLAVRQHYFEMEETVLYAY